MPPFDEDGNIIEPGQLYIENCNGEFIPFGGIQPIDTIQDSRYDYGAEWLNQESVTLSFSMTHKSTRVFRKMIHRNMNCMKRVCRTLARRKEKLRRESLKKGVKQHE